VGNKF